ncbi:hypothetical protein OO013_15715 [Mangrovivirga sp. M17]|uniref:Uncharacterized protein n=1 Tax=Mangrovivirga halotolerans TaxID=2993936 RepID=A0ABT3RU67_9BACT|nr:hypothetical protein [Mangrovivirga halotolerans]MCX2745325.1 hypothetical protein [Mangrovivirga halotolerans]
MTENEQHKKDAVLISVGLSSQLIAASLAFIAITGGIVTFVLTNRTPTCWFYTLYSFALIAFVVSMYFGGKGIQLVKKSGESGNWKTKDNIDPNWFDYQTKSILFGIVIAVFLPFTGEPKEKKNDELKQIIEILKLELNLKSESVEQNLTSDSLRNIKLIEIEKRIEKLESKAPNKENISTLPNKH